MKKRIRELTRERLRDVLDVIAVAESMVSRLLCSEEFTHADSDLYLALDRLDRTLTKTNNQLREAARRKNFLTVKPAKIGAE